MNYKILFVAVLVMLLLPPIVSADTSINEGAQIYPVETSLWQEVTGGLFGFLFPTTTPTPEMTVTPTQIPTPIETPLVVNAAITQAELIPVSPSSIDVHVADGSVITAKQMGDTDSLKIELSKSGATKIVQVEPETKTIFSPDGLEMMQTSLTANPSLQIYYGYRIDVSHPFTYLYKVNSIDTDPVVAYRTDFDAGSMSMSNVSREQIVGMINKGSIPAYEELP